MRIENLWQFRNLEKLQLDNNIIEKIEGLDTLVHLEWLGRMLEPSLSPSLIVLSPSPPTILLRPIIQ